VAPTAPPATKIAIAKAKMSFFISFISKWVLFLMRLDQPLVWFLVFFITRSPPVPLFEEFLVRNL
jgi:membrane protease YdiL (CAAX protease family)